MILSEDELIDLDIRKIPSSYIIFNRSWSETVPGVLKRLREQGVHSISRYGSWNYSSMSDDIQGGIRTADLLNGEETE